MGSATRRVQQRPLGLAIVRENDIVTSTSNLQVNICWAALPQVLVERISKNLSVEDLVPFALSIGPDMNWRAVVEDRWPAYKNIPPPPTEGETLPDESGSLKELVSLVEASRLAAQLVKWPSACVQSGQFRGQAKVQVIPDRGCSHFRSCQGNAPVVNPAVLEWTTIAPEPACIRFDSEVNGVCLHSSVVAALSCTGEMRVIRRSDLKQVTSLKIRDAVCFDMAEETLVVATAAPARVLMYDLSIATPKVQKQSDFGYEFSFVNMFANSAETCICCVAREDAKDDVLEVWVLDCCGPLTVTKRFAVAGFGIGGFDVFYTADWQGRLSLWEVEAQQMKLISELPARAKSAEGGDEGVAVGAVAVAGTPGKFLAAVAPRHPDTPIWAFDIPRQAAKAVKGQSHKASGGDSHHPIVVANMSVAPRTLPSPESKEKLGTASWHVDLMHAEGPLVIAVAHELGSLYPQSDNPAPRGPRLFAWHLPSCRPLLAGCPTNPITTFARSPSNGQEKTCGRLVFAGAASRDIQDKDGRCRCLVVVPGAGKMKRISRRSGLLAPPRRVINNSDMKARGLAQGRRRR